MATTLTVPCFPETFTGLSLFGAEVLSVAASLVTNYSSSVQVSNRFTQPAVEVQNATFCNVTVTYTHPGQGDTIAVEAWLPQAVGWNGRLQAVGGAGWVAGRSPLTAVAMAGAVSDGYATVTTDAGLRDAQDSVVAWGLLSPGNPDLYSLINLASVSLDDEVSLQTNPQGVSKDCLTYPEAQAIIAKSLIKAYYGRGPEYSYWNGCSQGGRQGLMLAQRYPTAYDGIAAGAPPLQWTNNLLAMLWPQQFMSMLGKYPYPCELQAIAAAATSACDGLDGLVDGIVNEVDGCLSSFDPFELVGRAIPDCPEISAISWTAAAVANATWQGMRNSHGTNVWPGPTPGTDLAIGVANTDCSTGSCRGVLASVSLPWVLQFINRGADLDLTNLTHAEFDELVHRGQQRYRSIMEADDPDLSAFRNAGGKMVTYHGLVSLLGIFASLPRDGVCFRFLTPSHTYRSTNYSPPRVPPNTTTQLRHSSRTSMTFTVTSKYPAWATVAGEARAETRPPSSTNCARGSRTAPRRTAPRFKSPTWKGP